MLRQHLWRSGSHSSQKRLGLIKELSMIAMLRARFAGNCNSTCFEQSAKDLRREFSRVFYGQGFTESGITQRNCAPEKHFIRARIAVNANFGFAYGSGHNTVVE